MADIANELNLILTSTRGETVRDAIVSAVRKINNQMTPPRTSRSEESDRNA